MIVKAILFLLLVRNIKSNTELNRLIARIPLENIHSTTVCFIGIDGDLLRDFMNQLSYIPIVYLTSLTDKEILFSNVIIVFSDPESDIHRTFDGLSLLIRHLRHRKFVVITTKNYENLSKYFDFFWAKKFTRIFGVVEDISYVFFPFASSSETVRRVKNNGHLPNALVDLTNFTFRTTIQKDFPRAFRYTDSKGKSQIGGRVGLLFVNFVRRHNATFKEIVINNSTELFIPGVINATLRGDVDISMNIYGEVKGLDMSYPLKLETWNIMVPINGHLDPYEYFKRPFSSIVWMCIALTAIYITFIDFVINKLYAGLNQDIWQSFSQTFLIILGRPLIKPISSRSYRIHCLLFVFAFIMGNLYNIYFTSFLTVFIKINQYDKISDLVQHNVPVMIAEFEYELLIGFQNLEKVLHPVPNSVLVAEINSMCNTSFGYTIGGDKCEFLILLQSFYMKPLFRKAEEPLSEFYLGFLLPEHSPFKEILDKFIIEIGQTGLLLKWDADAAYQTVQAGHPIDVNCSGPSDTAEKMALTFRHLQFGFTCLAMGLTLGSVVFLCELSIDRLCGGRSFSKSVIIVI